MPAAAVVSRTMGRRSASSRSLGVVCFARSEVDADPDPDATADADADATADADADADADATADATDAA